jgi:hypothetical protein
VIEFEYGCRCTHEYTIGEIIRWEHGGTGVKKAKLVRVEGFPTRCPSCKTLVEFDIMVKENQIERVVSVGLDRLQALPNGFEVIE